MSHVKCSLTEETCDFKAFLDELYWVIMNIWNIISLLKSNLIVCLRFSLQGEKNIWWWKTHGSCYISSWLNFVFSSPSSASDVCRLCQGLWRQVWCRDRQGGQERCGLRVPGQNWEARVTERFVSSHHITSHDITLYYVIYVLWYLIFLRKVW